MATYSYSGDHAQAQGSNPSLGRYDKSSANKYIRETVDNEGRKVFQCKLCNMVTNFSSSMNRHMAIKHTKPNIHTCEYCHKTFNNKYYLTNHIARKECMRNVMFDP